MVLALKAIFKGELRYANNTPFRFFPEVAWNEACDFSREENLRSRIKGDANLSRALVITQRD